MTQALSISLHEKGFILAECRDVREDIFREHLERSVTATVTVEANGVLSGLDRSKVIAEGLGLTFRTDLQDGQMVSQGAVVASVSGNPVQIAKAEELLIGALSKTSGIATASRKAKSMVSSNCRIVCGGSKKLPHEIKSFVRKAVADGGLDVRMLAQPFLYLDKNYVRILGGVKAALETVAPLKRPTVIQVRGESQPIDEEALEAVRGGAKVIMVDTGRRDDLDRVAQAMRTSGVGSNVELAFSGNIDLDDLAEICSAGMEVLDIGYAILDAPCLPMRFDVVTGEALA